MRTVERIGAASSVDGSGWSRGKVNASYVAVKY